MHVLESDPGGRRGGGEGDEPAPHFSYLVYIRTTNFVFGVHTGLIVVSLFPLLEALPGLWEARERVPHRTPVFNLYTDHQFRIWRT